jgi:Uma2 family endonuclease
VLYRSTARSFEHQRVVWNLVVDVGVPFRRGHHGIGVLGPICVLITPDEPVQPDLLLIRPERAGIIDPHGHIHAVPDLVAEVLSPGFPELDTVIKRAAYARAGLPEYWMVRPASRDVVVLTEPDAQLSGYTASRLFASDAEIVSPTLPIRIPVAALFDAILGDRGES